MTYDDLSKPSGKKSLRLTSTFGGCGLMYERTSTKPKRAEHLKMEKVPVFLVGDVGRRQRAHFIDSNGL